MFPSNSQAKQDPRLAKHASHSAKIIISGDSGDIVTKPIPAGRRGKVPPASTNFKDIREAYVKDGTLFEDEDFPADHESLFHSQKPVDENIKWLRPKQICENPQFIMDGVSRFDVKQGTLGDCWFLASIATVALHQDLMERLVPKDQSFTDGYCGAFRFNIWYQGKWREVIIDDRLPTKDNRLIYVASSNPNEFWAALLEKAYAKLKGTYESLDGGWMDEAMMDLTGGICEKFPLRDKAPENLVDILNQAQIRKSVVTTCINKKATDGPRETNLENGLFGGHAYSVTKFMKNIVDSKGTALNLIRIRNPWGNASEWTGAWRDKAPEWNTLSDQQKRDMDIEYQADGEFWMDLKDFCREFSEIYICHLNIQTLGLNGHKSSNDNDKCWKVSSILDGWTSQLNAGGWVHYKETYSMNPQYKITVEADEGDKEGKGTIIVGLMLIDYRSKRMFKEENPPFSYVIWNLRQPDLPMDKNFFPQQEIVYGGTPAYVQQMANRHTLKAGQYMIVPATFYPNQESEFLLRIFYESHGNTISEPVKKRADMNARVPVPEAIKPQPITDVNKKELQVLHAQVAGEYGGIHAEEVRRILNEAVKYEFTTTKLDVRTAANKPKTYETDEVYEAGAVQLPNGQPGRDSTAQEQANDSQALPKKAAPSGGGGGGFLSACMSGFKNVKNQAAVAGSKLSHNIPMPKRSKAISIETARSLVACLDYDRSGCLDFAEFEDLWDLVRTWRSSFVKHDLDKSGTMNSFEMKNALEGAGFKLDNDLYSIIIARYASRSGDISFDDFISCCARLKTNMDVFDVISDGDSANIGQADFMTLAMFQ